MTESFHALTVRTIRWDERDCDAFVKQLEEAGVNGWVTASDTVTVMEGDAPSPIKPGGAVLWVGEYGPIVVPTAFDLCYLLDSYSA